MSFRQAKAWLNKYFPNVNERRFWVTQLLVILIAGVHTAFELLKRLGHPPVVGSSSEIELLSFIPISFFFIPVIYAALNFGFVGSVATAAWCTILTIPNFMLHPGTERVAEMFQIGIVDIVAVFLGQRVDMEWAARHEAETTSVALKASETRYRGLFESSPLAIVVLDAAGVVLEANPAAISLFGGNGVALENSTLHSLIGMAAADRLLANLDNNGDTQVTTISLPTGAAEVYLEPAVTYISDSAGRPAFQIQLRDVTEEHQRQVGLKAYTSHMLQAQEEERRRIAQELHDDAVQKLILVCRQLDVIESASEATSSPVAKDIRKAREAAEEVGHDLRDFAKSLRPPILDDLGLVTSIRRLVVDIGEMAGIEGYVNIYGKQRRHPPDVEVGLFRIAQEALRNVERHAKATHINVTLTFAEDLVTLEVTDNGIGFVPPVGAGDLASRNQLGLLGMSERAELLGGQLQVRSSPGNGTTILASIPG